MVKIAKKGVFLTFRGGWGGVRGFQKSKISPDLFKLDPDATFEQGM